MKKVATVEQNYRDGCGKQQNYLIGCKTCKHWQPEDTQEQGALLGGGECKKAPQVWDVADRVEGADEWTTNYQIRPEHAAVLAVVEDGSTYHARLVTMPDFGCVQHEQA